MCQVIAASRKRICLTAFKKKLGRLISVGKRKGTMFGSCAIGSNLPSSVLLSMRRSSAKGL